MAQFHSVRAAQLPSSGVAGDIWYTTDTQEVYVVIPSSLGTSLIPLNSLFSTYQNVGVGPEGATGANGPQGQSFNWRGDWNVGDNYAPYDCVFYNGSAYVAITQVQAGNIPQFPDGDYWNVLAAGGSGGGGDTELSELSDCSITSPTNGEVLTWNSTAGKWENEAPTGGDTELSELTDVQLATPSDGDVLTYVSAASKWENKPSSGGGNPPVYPRAGAGPWRVWAPNYNSFGGNSYIQSGGSGYGTYLDGGPYSPADEENYCVAALRDITGSGSIFGCEQFNFGPSSKPYFKSRANLGGGTSSSNFGANEKYRAWLGMGDGAYYQTNYNTDAPGEPVYAFTFSSDVGTTIKCYVGNGVGPAFGWAGPTIIDTGIVPDTDFHDFEIDMGDGANIVFSIDGTVVATVPIVIAPTGPVYPNDITSLPFIHVQALGSSGSPAIYNAYVMFHYIYIDFPNI